MFIEDVGRQHPTQMYQTNSKYLDPECVSAMHGQHSMIPPIAAWPVRIPALAGARRTPSSSRVGPTRMPAEAVFPGPDPGYNGDGGT